MTTNLHDKMLAAIDAYFSASNEIEAHVAEEQLLDVRAAINNHKLAAKSLTEGLRLDDWAKIGCVNHDCDQCKALAEQPAQQDIPDLIAGALGVSRGTAYDMMREALAEQSAQQTCNCRWEGEVQVQQCTLHEAHIDAIHEWAGRAKAAEAKLAEQPARQEPVAGISVKDALPKAVRGASYNASLTDVVLVRHSDRPDYPITAHAVVGEGLGAGIAIPTNGASEHPEIAWYSASSNLNNPFDLKNDDYGRYLPKVFGSKITHWKPIEPTPPAQPAREWVNLTVDELIDLEHKHLRHEDLVQAIEAKLKEKNT